MGIWDVMKTAFKEGYDGVQKPPEVKNQKPLLQK